MKPHTCTLVNVAPLRQHGQGALLKWTQRVGHLRPSLPLKKVHKCSVVCLRRHARAKAMSSNAR